MSALIEKLRRLYVSGCNYTGNVNAVNSLKHVLSQLIENLRFFVENAFLVCYKSAIMQLCQAISVTEYVFHRICGLAVKGGWDKSLDKV